MRFIVSILALLAWSCSGATYYVSPSGSDTNSGTIAAPWRTLQYATGGWLPNPHYPWHMEAGDTLYLRGGLYPGNEHCIELRGMVTNTGTADSPITIAAFPGEVPIITEMSNWPCMNFQYKAHYLIRDLIFSNMNSGLYLSSCTNFVISNCTFTAMRPGITNADGDYRYFAVGLTASSQSNIFINNFVTNWGVGFQVSTTQWQIAGSPFGIGAEAVWTDFSFYNLVQGNTFGRCGHDCFGVIHGYNIIRSNLFYNDPWRPTNQLAGWQYYNYGNPRIYDNAVGAWGARIAKTGGGNNDFTLIGEGYPNTPDHRIVYEYNTFVFASFPSDSNDAAGLGLCTRLGIYRFNTIAYCQGSGIYLEHSGAQTLAEPVATNNPAFYHRGMVVNPTGTNEAMSTLNCVYHNTIYRNGTLTTLGVPITFPLCGLTIANCDGAIVNNFFVNNIFWGNSPTNIENDIYTGLTCQGEGYVNLSNMIQVLRTNWVGDVPALGYPQFVSTNGFGYVYHPTNVPDLRLLSNSPCIDVGDWLTTTMAAGTGSVMEVYNSLYFSDGNHMVQGDMIQLGGTTNRAVVLANDWTNDTLYLDRPLTWTNGQGVSLAYAGNAPDMGAFESGVTATNGPAAEVAVSRGVPPSVRVVMQ